jgi:ABC-type antimicrobial peptide transport system permease subunit
MRGVVRDGMLVALAGIGVGLAGALAVGSLLATLLFGVEARDPATFAGVAAALVTIAGAACYVPARRASRVDPILALREE